MPTYDYVCPEGHVFDGLYDFNETVVPCRGCLGEPGIARGFSEVQLRMARVFAKQTWERLARLDKTFDEMGEPRPNKGWEKKARRCLLAMPSWMAKNANTLKIVVHRDPKTGQYRFPGRHDAPVPRGFEALEIDSVAKARKVEKAVQEQEHQKAADWAYRRLAQKDSMLTQNAQDLRSALNGDPYEVPDHEGKMVKVRGLTPKGKELVAEGIRHLEEQRLVGPKIINAEDTGFEALSYNKSNRDGHRDAATDWKKVQE